LSKIVFSRGLDAMYAFAATNQKCLNKSTPGNKGKTWADRFIECLVACGSQSTYVDSSTGRLFGRRRIHSSLGLGGPITWYLVVIDSRVAWRS